MRTAVQADADGVHILLDRRLYDHLRRLPKPGIDHFDASVTEGARHHFDATVVSIETHFGGEHSPALVLIHRRL